MSLSVRVVELRLRAPFRVGPVELTSWPTVLIALGEGRGECTPLPLPGWSPAEVRRALEAVDADAMLAAETLDDALSRLPEAVPPVRSALDMALHDHFARRAGVPVWQLLGLDPAAAPPTTISLGVQPGPEALEAALAPTAGFRRLKLKVGAGDVARDLEVVRALRARDERPLLVDANGAWSPDDAARALPVLAELGVAAVEQPVPWQDREAWAALRARVRRAAPPLVADESLVTAADLEALAAFVDGVNLKLSKNGGIAATRALARRARALGLQVMIGCYLESSLAIGAAAQIAGIADTVDLDGHLGLADDPFEGTTVEDGVVRPGRGPGLGVTARRVIGESDDAADATVRAAGRAASRRGVDDGGPALQGAAKTSPGVRPVSFDVDAGADPAAFVAYLARMSADPRIAAAKQRMHALLGLRPGESVLDVGCGGGGDVVALATLVGPEGRATGVDRSVTMIDAARAEAARAGVSADFHAGDAEALPFPDASFDVVRTERVLMHVPDPEKAVAELARVVRPGGRVLWDPLESTCRHASLSIL